MSINFEMKAAPVNTARLRTVSREEYYVYTYEMDGCDQQLKWATFNRREQEFQLRITQIYVPYRYLHHFKEPKPVVEPPMILLFPQPLDLTVSIRYVPGGKALSEYRQQYIDAPFVFELWCTDLFAHTYEPVRVTPCEQWLWDQAMPELFERFGEQLASSYENVNLGTNNAFYKSLKNCWRLNEYEFLRNVKEIVLR